MSTPKVLQSCDHRCFWRTTALCQAAAEEASPAVADVIPTDLMPECCVRNAFGDTTMHYARCHSNGLIADGWVCFICGNEFHRGFSTLRPPPVEWTRLCPDHGLKATVYTYSVNIGWVPTRTECVAQCGAASTSTTCFASWQQASPDATAITVVEESSQDDASIEPGHEHHQQEHQQDDSVPNAQPDPSAHTQDSVPSAQPDPSAPTHDSVVRRQPTIFFDMDPGGTLADMQILQSIVDDAYTADEPMDVDDIDDTVENDLTELRSIVSRWA